MGPRAGLDGHVEKSRHRGPYNTKTGLKIEYEEVHMMQPVHTGPSGGTSNWPSAFQEGMFYDVADKKLRNTIV